MRTLVLAVTLLTATAVASPATERVVVASGDANFRAAMHDALVPTGMDMVPVADQPPTIAELAVTARQIAEREGAASTVWLITAPDKTTLVTYDRDVDRTLVREVPYGGPLSPPQAAEVARMARTMLRTLRVSPELNLPLPRVAEARVERQLAADAPALRARVPRLDLLAISVGGSVRVGAPASEAGLEARLTARWRPDQPGLGLELGLANRATVVTATFAGRIVDHGAAIMGHAPLLTGPRVHVLGLVGVAVHLISMDGMVGATPTSTRRFDPAIRAGLVAHYELGPRIDVGVAIATDGLLRRQRYVAGPDEVLVVPRLQLTTGLQVAIRFL